MATRNKSRSESNEPTSLVNRMAEKFSIDSDDLLQTLKATAFRQTGNTQISNEQMYALLIVSDQYNLNPFTKEIYAFPDKQGGIVPVVGVDGWNRISNEHSQFDGVEFVYSDEVILAEGAGAHCHAWIEAVLYRKDRSRPIRVREYLDECYRSPFVDKNTGYVKKGPWQTHPKRLLRHKAEIQCYRIGFGFVGIYDEDEAYRIIEGQSEEGGKLATVVPMMSTSNIIEENSNKLENKTIDDGFNKSRVDAFLVKLFDRAKKEGKWQAAEEYIEARLDGKSVNYAKQELIKVRAQFANNDSDRTDNSPKVVSDQAAPEMVDKTVLEGNPVKMEYLKNTGACYF
jgi:phage recombination protein Bet